MLIVKIYHKNDQRFSRCSMLLDSVYCVSMHPQLGVVASGGGDDKAFLWDPTDGKTLFELSGNENSLDVIIIVFTALIRNG
jgi:WD40 repeat protein